MADKLIPEPLSQLPDQVTTALHVLNQYRERQIARELTAWVRQRDQELASVRKNRDHFCYWINEIARLFWGDDKQCYAPDATFRMVEAQKKRLAVLEAGLGRLLEQIKATTSVKRAGLRKAIAEAERLLTPPAPCQHNRTKQLDMEQIPPRRLQCLDCGATKVPFDDWRPTPSATEEKKNI